MSRTHEMYGELQAFLRLMFCLCSHWNQEEEKLEEKMLRGGGGEGGGGGGRVGRAEGEGRKGG